MVNSSARNSLDVFLFVPYITTHGKPCSFPGWKTRDQLLTHYGGNVALDDAIIDKKIETHQYRDHPDAPGSPDAMLYYCLLDMSMTNSEDTSESMSTRVDLSIEAGSQAGMFGWPLHY